MRPYYEQDGIQIFNGNCLEVLRTLPPESINCCVTSPPYWGLRDYGVPGQLGLERKPEEYVSRMVEVFAEVRRVLKADGTLWLNLGDSYAAGKAGRTDHGSGDPTSRLGPNRDGLPGGTPPGPVIARGVPEGLKPKDLVGIPWRVAFALQADGWYLRSDIIWHKPNPMPESVTDRPTKAHEYLFLLAKSERYRYDHEAIKERGVYQNEHDRTGSGYRAPGQTPQKGNRADKQRGHGRRHAGFNARWDAMSVAEQSQMGRNKRTVWTVAPANYPEAHFATFPEDLVRPCILAGCPQSGVVLDPFAGSGTTLAVAKALGCGAVGIELNPEYCRLAEKRLPQGTLPLQEASA